ncbi:MAG: cysteine--tRNA ligase, partial [Candidatus Aminicenantes bacterium]|nr:cysteine--tRNA ligase [Candidatus Aminicenantes bacterium]
KNHPFKEGESKAVSKIIDRTRKNFAEGLSDDLNISVALRVLFDMIREVNSLIAKNKVFSQDAEKLMNLIHSIDSVLGVLPEEKEELLPAEITKKIEEREKARKDKDFESADRIRDELLDLGIMLEDTKDRVRWKRVKGKR